MMKKIYKVISLLLCVLFVSLPAFAAVNASKQIRNYTVDVSRTSDDIVIDFSVSANGTMDELGAESIVIYRKVGNHWVWEAEETRDGDGMTKSNKGSHVNTIYYPAEGDLEYKVVVTIFAENGDGYDSRTKTFYV